MNHIVAYMGGIYLLISCLLAGWVAQKKGDFFSRGFCIGLMAGIFAPIFFAMSPASRARQGNEADLKSWHVNGVFPTMAHVFTIVVLWVVFASVK